MTVSLHHELVAPAAPPRAWAIFTHGIYGSGGNWRSIARKVVERRPDWGAVLVDLRAHGRSPAGDPPHTVAACAADLAALAAALEPSQPVRAAIGHSFGGKCVLALRALRPMTTWMLDASPGARPGGLDEPGNTVADVLALLEALPPRFASRDAFVAEVTAAGQARPLAQWLAMNLAATPAGDFALRLDLAVVRALLVDYYATDLWPLALAAGPALHVVAATRSTSVSPDDRARLAQVHTVDAGHWLHIDAPDAVVDLLAGGLP